MIFARASRHVLAASFALCAVAAEADVMEVDRNGARWVAGGVSVSGPGTSEPGTSEPGLSETVLSDAVFAGGEELSAPYADTGIQVAAPEVPAEIIADPAAHSAGIPPAYANKVHEVARRFDLSPALLEAVVWQESRWRADAVSPAGARGLAQLMPGTARYLGVNPDDPNANLEGGARYLREQFDRFDGDLEMALAAYNAGPGRVMRAGGIPNIRETRLYVAAIMGRLANHSRPTAE